MAKILPIITNPNDILREISQNIDEKSIQSPDFKQLLEDMALTMVKKDGVGLAAPQIGKNIRIITLGPEENSIMHMINPIITKKSWAQEWGEEGCLSVPDTFGKVRRHKKIRCLFLDQNGKKRQIETEGFLARVIQHEIDHLDGILFIDKAKNIKKQN